MPTTFSRRSLEAQGVLVLKVIYALHVWKKTHSHFEKIRKDNPLLIPQ